MAQRRRKKSFCCLTTTVQCRRGGGGGVGTRSLRSTLRKTYPRLGVRNCIETLVFYRRVCVRWSAIFLLFFFLSFFYRRDKGRGQGLPWLTSTGRAPRLQQNLLCVAHLFSFFASTFIFFNILLFFFTPCCDLTHLRRCVLSQSNFEAGLVFFRGFDVGIFFVLIVIYFSPTSIDPVSMTCANFLLAFAQFSVPAGERRCLTVLGKSAHTHTHRHTHKMAARYPN